ncbi:MAG: HDIG domain-containing protein [Bacteroidaceae bacterium]
MNPHEIITKYYPESNAELRRILLIHSNLVCNKALAICDAHPELGADRQFVEDGALLHDIGIFLTDAPTIYCFGTEHYLRHGFLGAELMRKEGFPTLARVCERHTGAGLTAQTIQAEKLPLPPRDFVPETIEEKIICFADKFYSKNHLLEEKTPEQALHSLNRFGTEGAKRFQEWLHLFL